MEAETSPDINFNEETPRSSAPVSKFEQVEDMVNEDYEIIKEGLLKLSYFLSSYHVRD